MHCEEIQSALIARLQERRQGWKEYELLRALERAGVPGFEPDAARGVLGLYRRHCRLFHHLYALRDRLRGEASADLEIHCLDIRLLHHRSQQRSTQPAPLDALREHYRDLDELLALGEAEVETLMLEGLECITRRERRAEALGALGLADPVTDSEVRRRFHQLAMRHHPDRGGELARFQEISAAAARLAS